MNRRHVAAVSILLAAAAIAGVLALTRSTALGQTSSTITPTSAELASRAATLDRAEAQIRRTAARRPPALPPLDSAAGPRGTTQLSSAPATVLIERGEDDELEHGEDDRWEADDDHDDREHSDDEGEHDDDD